MCRLASLSITGVVSLSLLLAVTARAQSKVQSVQVTNFPAMQNVSGSVNVANLPAVQDVNVIGGCSAGAGTMQLVGFTAAAVTATGPLALTAACQSEFPGSRICTSEEVIKTRSVPQSLSGRAWVLPAFQASGGGMLDASGFPGSFKDMTCESWATVNSVSALTVDGSGAFFPMDCSEPRPVACCAMLQ